MNRLRRGLSLAFCFDAFDLDLAVTPAGMLCTVRDGCTFCRPQHLCCQGLLYPTLVGQEFCVLTAALPRPCLSAACRAPACTGQTPPWKGHPR